MRLITVFAVFTAFFACITIWSHTRNKFNSHRAEIQNFPIFNTATNTRTQKDHLQPSLASNIIQSQINSSTNQSFNQSYTFNDLPINPGLRIPPGDPRQQLILFSKLQKTGSTTVTFIMKKILCAQGYSVSESGKGPIDINTKEEWVRFSKSALRLRRPAFVARFLYHVDLAKFTENPPVIISMMRDPVTRFISFYNFIRFTVPKWGKNIFNRAFKPHFKSFKEWQRQDINVCLEEGRFDCQIAGHHFQRAMYYSLPHFCGPTSACQIQSLNSSALVRSILHIENAYSVVGVMERMEESVAVMADRVGVIGKIKEVYAQLQERGVTTRNRSGRKSVLTSKAEAKLQKMLRLDLQLYEYVNKRLDLQFSLIEKPE